MKKIFSKRFFIVANKVILALLSVIISSFLSKAQEQEFFKEKITIVNDFTTKFEVVNINNGLSNNTVYDILQDKYGFLWFATSDGLNKYDGYNFVVFKNIEADSNSISDNRITSIVEDNDGIIWVATFNGLNKYDRNTSSFKRFYANEDNPTKLQDNYIRKLFVDKQGVLWFDTQKGYLHKKTNSGFKHFKHKANTNTLYPQHCIFDDKNGKLYLGSPNYELLIFDKENEVFQEFKELLNQNIDSLANKSINFGGMTSAISDKYGNIYINFTHAKSIVYNSKIKRIKNLGNLTSVYSMLNDNKGNLWMLGYSVGIVKYNYIKNEINIFRYDNNNKYTVAHNQNYCSLIDKSGNIWFGGKGGITIYKPLKNQFKHYRKIIENKTTVSSNKISSIIQDKDSIIWLGSSDKGLIRFNYKNNKFKNYQNKYDGNKSILNNSVSSLYEANNGNIYVGQWTGQGFDIFEKKRETFTHCSTIHNRGHSDWISGFIENKDKQMFVLGWGSPGLREYSSAENKYTYNTYNHQVVVGGKKDVIVFYKNKIFSDSKSYNIKTKKYIRYDQVGRVSNERHLEVVKMNRFSKVLYVKNRFSVTNQYYISAKQKLYVATDKSLMVYVDSIENFKEIFFSAVNGITQYSDKELLLSTHKGIVLFNVENNKHRQFFNSKEILKTKKIFKDNRKNLWIATNKGLVMHNLKTKENVFHSTNTHENKLSNNSITDFVQDISGNVWISNHAGIDIYNFNNKKITKLNIITKQDKTLNNLIVNSIYKDHNSNIWLCTETGLYKFNYKSQKFKEYKNNPNKENSLSSNSVKSITQDKAGVFYIGTSLTNCSFNEKTNRFNVFNQETKYSVQGSLNLCGLTDSKGNMWIGQDRGAGLNFIDAKTNFVTHYFELPYDSTSFKGGFVTCVFEDDNGTIWVGSDKGLNKFNSRTNNFKLYNSKNGLPSDVVVAITQDKNGFLWITTENGLVKFDSTTNNIKTYTVEDGLQGDVFSLKSCITLFNNEIIVGGNNGFNIFYPDSIKTNKNTPLIALINFYIYDSLAFTDLSEIDKIKLTHYQNNFSISFSALEFSNSTRNLYKYKLEGYDANWVETTSYDRKAKYTNLPYGEYEFAVMASNNDGIWNESIKTIKIVITPPWWETWWAETIGILLFLLTILYFYKWRVSRLEIKQKQLEQTVKDRTFEVIEKNEELQQQSEELQLLNESLNQNNEEITAQRDEIESQRDMVQMQKVKIEGIHKEVSQSIDYATRLQQSVLPNSKLLKRYFSDYFILFKPKDKVSGDFYWWSHIESNTVVSIADSTGHGVPGAFMSMLGISFLREVVQKGYITHTGVILRKLRKEIIKTLKQEGKLGEHKDGMDMAIVSINNETNIMQFSGANNPLYIITNTNLQILNDNAETNSCIKLLDNSDLNIQSTELRFYEIKPDKMPIAIYDKMDKFKTHEIQLQKGDKIYMFSDGYADQFGGPKGKKFKYKPFKKLLLENANKSMAEQKELLSNAFEDWKADYEQIDDVVVLGIEI